MQPHLQEQFSSLCSFFHESSEVFALFDKDLNMIAVNKAGLGLFPFPEEELIGKNFTEIVPDLLVTGRYEMYREVIRTGKTLILDDIIPHVSMGHVRLRIKAFKVDEGMGLIVTDITDLKATIEELHTFLYRSSHDMRTPVASILALVDLIREGTEDRKEMLCDLDLIAHEANRIDSILQALLENARIQEHRLDLQLISMNQFVEEVLHDFRDVEEAGELLLEVNIDCSQPFYADRLLLGSVFRNLVDNAIKYRCEKEKSPFVRIGATDTNSGVRILIADNGIGIRENLQNRLFTMFFRATERSKGTGLGLYTAKRAIKKMGGNIALISKEQAGTIITIDLPNGLPA